MTTFVCPLHIKEMVAGVLTLYVLCTHQQTPKKGKTFEKGLENHGSRSKSLWSWFVLNICIYLGIKIQYRKKLRIDDYVFEDGFFQKVTTNFPNWIRGWPFYCNDMIKSDARSKNIQHMLSVHPLYSKSTINLNKYYRIKF